MSCVASGSLTGVSLERDGRTPFEEGFCWHASDKNELGARRDVTWMEVDARRI